MPDPITMASNAPLAGEVPMKRQYEPAMRPALTFVNYAAPHCPVR
jgi:hypothetical protein